MINEVVKMSNMEILILNPTFYFCSYDNDLLPKYSNLGDSGLDLKCATDWEIKDGVNLIPTGIKYNIPVGYEVNIRPRSGLSVKCGRDMNLVNSPGTGDSIYRGEVKLIFDFTLSDKIKNVFPNFIIKKGTRIAQMVIQKVAQPINISYEYTKYNTPTNFVFEIIDKEKYNKFDEIYESERNANGFGSTGI